MSVFGFGKKKEGPKECCGCTSEAGRESSCSCGSDTGSIAKNARFIVLGACCQKSTETFQNTKQAVAELGFTDEVINIGDNLEIVKYGVMQTPALVIDGRVVSYGKLLKVDDVKKIIEKVGVKP